MVPFLRANAWIVVIVAAAIGALFLLVDPAPPREITLATGVTDGAYHQFGQRLAERLSQDGLEVHLQTFKGSVENLERLRSQVGEASIALVQSGLVATADAGELRGLGSLFYEPLWVFHRSALEPDSLRDLRGLRMAVGEKGSGTRAVALKVLEAHGIGTPGDTASTLVDLGGNAAVEALLDGTIDATFLVAAARSSYLEKLQADSRAQLFSVRRQQAFRASFPQLTTLKIGEGQLDLAANLPSSACGVLASVATLVVNDRFHPGLTPLVLNAVRDLLKTGGVLERPGEFPQALSGDFPLTREAEHYHRYGLPFMMRYLPFWAASLFDRLIILMIPMLALLIPVFKTAPPLYRWRTRRKIFRWYRHLREIDGRIRSGTIVETVDDDLDRLRELQDEIMRVDVPLSYSDELYELHLHIDWVIHRLERLKKESGGAGETMPAGA